MLIDRPPSFTGRSVLLHPPLVVLSAAPQAALFFCPQREPIWFPDVILSVDNKWLIERQALGWVCSLWAVSWVWRTEVPESTYADSP
ncbi:MAG TPA: hypothetical protein VKA76_02020, partial [Gammaproteobacteria bacterium]|nr:hypothetical protein [Gammaproteobacteria bacterium]